MWTRPTRPKRPNNKIDTPPKKVLIHISRRVRDEATISVVAFVAAIILLFFSD